MPTDNEKSLTTQDDEVFHFGLKQRIYNWNMRNAREKKGWSQKDLAKATGVGMMTVGHFETLRQFPKQDQAKRIATALGHSVESLFPGWLKEFKLERVPRSSQEEKIALHEIPMHLVPTKRLLVEGWENDIERVAQSKLMRDDIYKALDTLNPREKQVIELIFGLEDGCSRTQEEVGKEFGVTKERIRQIEAKALRKLRHPSRSRALKDLLY